ncbi:hypothetical protein ABIB94_006829 [Bradyrhizobium sp. JR7.2]|uniref:hypothetical protein n=1 Tax=unclassified Bradyrhizobium TaxID=2631580 RepID=UPI0033995421
MTTQTIRAYYPDFVVLRSLDDLDAYEDAVDAFARGGGQRELTAALFALGIPASQIRAVAAYPGCGLPAMCVG